MEEDAHVSVGYYRGPLSRVLSGISRAGLEGAELHLDGESEELEAFVKARTAHTPELARHNARASGRTFLGILTVSSGSLRLPVQGSTMPALIELAEGLADPEVAICLSVREGERVLIDAPDVGDNEIWVHSELPAEAVEALVTELRPGLTTGRP